MNKHQIYINLNRHNGNTYQFLYSLLPEIFNKEELKDIFLSEKVIGIIINRQTFREIFDKPVEECIAYSFSRNTKDLSEDDENYIVFVYADTLEEKAKSEGISTNLPSMLRFYVELPTIDSNVKLSLMKEYKNR